MSDGKLRKRGAGYTAVPNQFVRNADLCIEARMLFILLNSHKEGWTFRRQQLAKNLKLGRDRMDRAIGELRENGYLETVQPLTEAGAVIPGPWDWIIDLSPAMLISALRKPAGAETSTPLEEHLQEYQVQDTTSTKQSRSDAPRRILDALGNAANPRSHKMATAQVPLGWVCGQNACDLELDLLPTIERLSASVPPHSISSWNYYRTAVFEARDTRLNPPANPTPKAQHDRPNNPNTKPTQAQIIAERRERRAALLAERRGEDCALDGAEPMDARRGRETQQRISQG